MREVADTERIERFMRALGRAADADCACYFTGGATAVLLGWRGSTIDVDIRLVPESDTLLRAIQRIKEELQINVELASPDDFIPVPAGWEGRSVFVTREGRVSFYHFDPYSQALGKLERAHDQDLGDVRAVVERRLVDPSRALAYREEIEPQRAPSGEGSSRFARSRRPGRAGGTYDPEATERLTAPPRSRPAGPSRPACRAGTSCRSPCTRVPGHRDRDDEVRRGTAEEMRPPSPRSRSHRCPWQGSCYG